MPTNISNNQYPSLIQGKKYKNFQQKIENHLEKRSKKLSGKEGFIPINISKMNLPSNSNAIQSNNIVNNNTITPEQQEHVSNLQSQYQNVLAQYQTLL